MCRAKVIRHDPEVGDKAKPDGAGPDVVPEGGLVSVFGEAGWLVVRVPPGGSHTAHIDPAKLLAEVGEGREIRSQPIEVAHHEVRHAGERLYLTVDGAKEKVSQSGFPPVLSTAGDSIEVEERND